MKQGITNIEKKQYFNRMFLSTLAAALFHLVLISLFLLLNNFQKKSEDVIVVTVRLPDKIFEQIDNMDKVKKEKFIKKQRKEIEKKRIKTQKEKNSQPDLTKTQTSDNNSTQQKATDKIIEIDKTTDKQEDLWDSYTKANKTEKDQVENDFFNNQNEIKTEEDKYLAELDNLDNLLANLESDNSNQNNNDGTTISKTSNNDGEISWSTGRKRELIESSTINIPSQYTKTGQKYSITLEFTVHTSGLIQKIDIIESTGYSELDTLIAEQFKLRKFERDDNTEIALGKIKISIGY